MEKNDLDKVYYAPNPVVKRTNVNRKPLFYGLILGIILFAAIYIGLYYSGNIASLKNLIKNNKPVTLNNISPILQEKAKKAGYEIIWQGDPNDTTGRTIMASGKRMDKDYYTDQFGWQKKRIGEKQTKKDIYRGQGVFERFEAIPGSKDLYIVLSTFGEDEIKARIVMQKPNFDKSGKPVSENFNMPTKLMLDNLEYGPGNKSIQQFNRINYIYKINEKEKGEIFKKGDMIVLLLHPIINFNNKAYIGIEYDDNKIPVVEDLTVRRFSGKLKEQ